MNLKTFVLVRVSIVIIIYYEQNQLRGKKPFNQHDLITVLQKGRCGQEHRAGNGNRNIGQDMEQRL